MSRSLSLRQTIETEIVDGRLALGSRLDETELAERFGVSRTPIREALLQLAMTGLVEIKPRRGAIVSAPDPELLIAMFETMAEIEASCGRLAARRLIPADEKALKQALAACAVGGGGWRPRDLLPRELRLPYGDLSGLPQRLPVRAGAAPAPAPDPVPPDAVASAPQARAIPRRARSYRRRHRRRRRDRSGGPTACPRHRTGGPLF